MSPSALTQPVPVVDGEPAAAPPVPEEVSVQLPARSASPRASVPASERRRAEPTVQSERETRYRLHRRFDRMGRLVGDSAMERLFGAHVMVVGLGGVGSFAVESLVRSGVGRLTLVDFDRVCVTNSNRQLQAVHGVIGKTKAAVLAERVKLINPQAEVEAVPLFYSERTAEALLGRRPDWVVDAIDNVTAKCHLLATCRARAIPVVCSTGASGRWDPTQLRIADLAETRVDPLADAVRRALRQKYAFPRQGPFGIPAVFSVEHPARPHELHYDGGEGFTCVCPGGDDPDDPDRHSCGKRPVIYGTASFVTGSFGLHCASVVVRGLVGESAPASSHAAGSCDHRAD